MDKRHSADAVMASWAAAVYGDEDPVLGGIRARQAAAGLPEIQVGPLDGVHLEVIARAIAATRVVEIGTLGGYSGVRLLRGMPGGTLYTFEASPSHAEVARQSFAAAGFAERARIFVGPALSRLPEIEGEGPFDLVFIDADKVAYPAYLEWAEAHLRPGGVVLGDNAFLFGRLGEADPGDDPAVTAMRRFNERLARGGSFRATMLPTGEGLAVGVKVR